MGRGQTCSLAAAALGLVWPTAVLAATLPPHRPLRLLIVSDFVNPHGLPPSALVEPGDLGAAFLLPGNGLRLDGAADAVLELPTNSLELATAALSVPRTDPAAYDVLVYFAHRIPDNGPDNQTRQDAFTAAVDGFLRAGGGMVVYHHGAYDSPGKAGILDLIGGRAWGAVPWNTSEGQNVIGVAPGHFVVENGIAWTGTLSYADPARGVPAGSYRWFNNRPDERYLNFETLPGAGTLETLFASNYDESGTTHLLGFSHRRPEWCGAVIAYQPGEYQPNMLDPAGNNFQVLANELVWAARARIDVVALRAVREAGTGSARITWTGGEPCWELWRAAEKTALDKPGSRLAQPQAADWTDSPAAGEIWYYRVTTR